MYSFVTLSELALITDPGQVEAIAEVMDSADYGFSDADPGRVVVRERQLQLPGTAAFFGANPACDVELVDWAFDVLDPCHPSRISAILPKLHENSDPEAWKRIGQKFGKALNPIVKRLREDRRLLARAKRRYRSKHVRREIPPYTEDLLSLAIHFIGVNETMRMTSQEWFDTMHVIVPVSYFDFVLLDKRWCHFIRNDCPLGCPDIAQVFSQKELDSFFAAIANFHEK